MQAVFPAADASRSASAAERRALASLDLPGLVACLQRLLQIPSITGSAAESEAQHWFAGQLRDSDCETDLWSIDLDSTCAHPDFPGLEAPRREAWGLVGRWGEDGPTLILNGHMDVVPAGDVAQWHAGAPFSGELRDGKVFGRGACDMKGGLVCNLYALRAIQAAGLRLRGRVLLQSVVGEEDGGLGTFATLLRGHRGDAAIIPEPTDLQIIPACAGALTFRLRFTGRSTHASVRDEGVSTLEKFWPVWQELEALEARRNRDADALMARFRRPYPLSIGVVRAGEWPSSVPDQLVAEGRLGVALGESSAAARRALEEAVARACARDEWLRRHPVQIEWFGGQFASGSIPAEHPLVALVQAAHAGHAATVPAVHGAPYGSDLRLMVGLGQIPTLHYGPGHVRHAHAPDEYVPVSDLETVARTLVLCILRFCGCSEP